MNKSETRWWYFDNFINSEEYPSKLSFAELEKMKLPIVPKELKSILSVRWKNKDRFLANNASEAFINKKNIPLIEIKLKNFGISEEYAYHDAHQEIQFFIETAKELIR